MNPTHSSSPIGAQRTMANSQRQTNLQNKRSYAATETVDLYCFSLGRDECLVNWQGAVSSGDGSRRRRHDTRRSNSEIQVRQGVTAKAEAL